MRDNLRIELVQHNSQAYLDTVRLRDEILRKPLGLTFSDDDLQAESSSFHVACYLQEELVGCLILKPDTTETLKMRQVAVSDKKQGLGIGRAMVEYSEEFARTNGFTNLSMNARDTAVPFYLKLGYHVEGEPFEEVTITHRFMTKNIRECAKI